MQIYMISYAFLFVETKNCDILMYSIYLNPYCDEIEHINICYSLG